MKLDFYNLFLKDTIDEMMFKFNECKEVGDIYQEMYSLLSEIVDLSALREKGYLKYKSSGFMDLNVDFLMEYEQKREVIALSH